MNSSLDDHVVATRECPYCDAAQGAPCVVAARFKGAGRRASWTHEARYGDLRHVFWLGYEMGERNGIDSEHFDHTRGLRCQTAWREIREAPDA